MQISAAADVQLAWDTVSDSRVAYYEVHHGTASQNYANKVTATGTTAAITGLSVGQTYYFAARACDQAGTACSAFSNEISTTVPGTQPPLSITTASLPTGTVGAAYAATLAASGGTGAYSWSVTSGSLPSGLTLNSATGAITGTPTAATTSSFTARVTDSASPAATSSKAVSITVAAPTTPPPLALTTGSLPNGTAGAAYSATLAATGGTGAYSWSVASGSLPSGLTLNPTTGTISGAPTAVATSNFTARVTDSASPTATSSKALSIAVAAMPTTVTIWPSTAVPGTVDGGADSSVELGIKFRSDVAGTITGIRFYKASTNTGTHVGNLWSSTGTKLATATFTSETASGWQQVNFSSPVPITANTVYVASYHANTGHYSADVNYFATAGVDNPPLHALANGVSGGNSVYAYGSSSVFPTQTWNAANYWVDVVFSPASAPTLSSIAVTPASATIPVGGTQQFTATGTYSNGTTQNLTGQVTWTSASTAVASINAAGLATGLGAGQAAISATLGSVTGTSGSVQVLAAPVADFAASTRSGTTPITTTFSCKSTGAITARTWTFGDGTASTTTQGSADHTYTAPGTYTVSLKVSGPGGEATAVKAGFITVNAAAPVAAFTGDVLQGPAPLTVVFHNDSTGQVTASSWSFGDGATSGQTHPSHTYTEPGLYAVGLTVSGPGGTNTLTRSAYVRVDAPALPMEVGEVLVNDQWQRVSFQTPFTDPIVVANPLSGDGADPAVVRVYGIDRDGFWIRVQEWDYLDGQHPDETVSYMVIERGRHQLPDGAWVEAGRLANGTIAFTAATFSEPFTQVPVVFAAVTSINEADAVLTRMRAISVTGFQIRTQEQQSNRQKHLPESIDYIAWEPSFGVVNGLRYEVGLIGSGISSKGQTLVYQAAFAQPPMLAADMQTMNGADPASLRWRNRNEAAAELWVSEEQSKDTETGHTAESVGYFAADEEQ
jgi:PKD repeat protein